MPRKVSVSCAKCGGKAKPKARTAAKPKPKPSRAKPKPASRATKKTPTGAALSKAIKAGIKKADCKCGNTVKMGK
jgi:hypothetical protein